MSNIDLSISIEEGCQSDLVGISEVEMFYVLPKGSFIELDLKEPSQDEMGSNLHLDLHDTIPPCYTPPIGSKIELSVYEASQEYIGSQLVIPIICKESQGEDIDLVTVGYIGESLFFDFVDSYIIETYSGENFVPILQTKPWSPFVDFNIFAGSNLASILASISNFEITWFDGSSLASSLESYPSINLSTVFFEGADLEYNLKTFVVLDGAFYQGSFANTLIYYRPAWLPVFDLYDGGSINLDLATALLFNPTSNDGSVFESDIETAPSSDIELPIWHGSNSYSNLSLTYSFEGDSYSGESLSTELQENPMIDIGLEFEEGSSKTISIRTQSNIFVPIYIGEHSSTTIEYHPKIDLQAPIEVGERVSTSLRIAISFKYVFCYDGANLETDLIRSPQKLLQGDSYEGSYSEINLAVDEKISNVEAYEGSAVYFDFQYSQFWNVYSGERFNFGFATTSALELTPINFGQRVSSSIYYRPSEGIGVTEFNEGSVFYSDLKIKVSAYLEMPFYHSERVIVELGEIQSTQFRAIDLTDCSCSMAFEPIPYHIELAYADPVDFEYWGDKTWVQCALSTTTRFEFEFTEGSNLHQEFYDEEFYEGISALSFNINYGQKSQIFFETVFDLTRLCKGNFIPDSDAIFVELETPYNGKCEAYWFFNGSRLENLDLSTEQNLRTDATGSGEHVFFDMTLEPILLFRIWYESRLNLPKMSFTYNLPSVFYEGLTSSFVFEPLIIDMGDGSAVDIVALRTPTFVVLKEKGCLINEFVYLDELGDETEEQVRIAFESMPFKHQIK